MGEQRPVTPWSARLSLDEVVQRLQGCGRVRAISFLGSTGTPRWTEASDFDVCVLLDGYPAGVGVETTIVDGRITDVVVVDAGRADGAERPFIRWLAESRPIYDPDGLATEVRDEARRLTDRDAVVDRAWQQTTRSFVTHDMRVNAALLGRADDPVLRVALGMRQLHTFVAVVQAWFTARGLPSQGWKKDVGHLVDADPQFFDIVDRWLATNDLHARHKIYCEAVAHALGPLGGPLPDDTVLTHADEIWETLSPPAR